MIVHTLRTLLAGSVDYAGLFPPAQLTMDAAVRSYADYRRSDRSWMLGAFVLPAARAEEFLRAVRTHAPDDRVPVSLLLGIDPETDIAGPVASMRTAAGDHVTVVSCEARTPTPDAVHRAAAAAGADMPLFCEVPPDDPVPLLQEVQAAGVRAKIRTGGVTADLFPAPRVLARFILACTRLRVPFKATAGLHHPVRGEYPLTYEEGAPQAVMFGFLNVLAAGVLALDGAPPDLLEAVLTETDRAAFRLDTHGLHWRDRTVAPDAIERFRRGGMTGFGSCSFTEPVRDLIALGLL